jgi:hypothetical protein
MPLRDVGRLTAWKTVEQAPKSRAFRRIQATRKMLGTKIGKLSRNKDVIVSTEEDKADAALIDNKKEEVSVM